MITSYNIEISMRKYLMDKYGHPAVLKKQGWKVPDNKPFFSLHCPISTYNMLSKNKELIQENVLIELGIFTDTMHELADIHSDVKLDILYEAIPLLDASGTVIGKFSFAEMVSDSGIIDDVQSPENETALNRRYIEARLHLALFKR